MTHGAKNQGNFLWMMGNIRGLLHNFGHEDDILGAIQRFKRSKLRMKLVTQN
jgi:hypothetical protein